MPKEYRKPSKQNSKNKLTEPKKHELETNTTECRFLRKRTLDSDTIIPASKKKSFQRSIRDHRDVKENTKELLVRPKSNASLLSETKHELVYMNCPKCFYKCKNPKKYEKHSCNKVLANMKSCFVTLNTFPGLDINYSGNFLFFQCRQCSRFFSDGYSYSKHLLTHPKTPTNRSIKTIKLHINGTSPTNDNDQMVLDADENTNNVDRNTIFVKSYENTPSVSYTSNVSSNAPKKSHPICNTFVGNLSSKTKHSCNKISANMKTCAVVLNIFPGLDINTRGNVLFFQCQQCCRYFIDGSQHLTTHPNSNIKTILLNINSSYPTPTVHDPMLVDADKNINHKNGNNATSLNLDKSTVNNCTLNQTSKNGYSSGHHLKTQFNENIETISLNINSSAIDDPILVDADRSINHSNGNATSLNPDESTVNTSTLSQTSKNGNSSGQHLLTHLETQFNGSIETISPNINSLYPAVDDDPMVLDAENINNNVTSVNPDENTINHLASNVQKESRKYCSIS